MVPILEAHEHGDSRSEREGSRRASGGDRPSRVRRSRRRRPSLLLPRPTFHCRKLPHVSGGSREGRQARRFVCHAAYAWNEDQNRHAPSPQSERRCDGVSACKPPSRLPHLRPRWRVRPPGPVHGVRRRPISILPHQARRRGQKHRPSDPNHHDALHPLHEVRALLLRSRRRARPGHHGPRQLDGNRHVRRGHLLRLGDVRQRHRPLSRRSAHLQAVRLPRASLGAAEHRVHRRH
mmetsp:Transcript_27297/g.48254  ORF Transcript_27297/g.48254 Transcript_27297/m.48254 type:complete len:235 (-) Transcript_27297:1760-2464(-)